MITLERIAIIVGAVLATLLQVLLAPHIPIAYAIPNFMVAYCMAVSVVRASEISPVLPFLLGLLYDLMSGGPVGAMAFTLTLFSMLSAWLFQRANNDTRFMAIAVLVMSILFVELTYGMVYLLFGYAAGFIEAIVYRIVPCFLYDAVIAVVLYFAVSRLLRREAPLQSEIRQLP